jgi:hypothetical protein
VPRYIVRLDIAIFNDAKRRRVIEFLRKRQLTFDESARGAYIHVRFEKSDPGWRSTVKDLHDLSESKPLINYEPAFDPIHLMDAEWLHLIEGPQMTWWDWSNKVGLAERRPRLAMGRRADFGTVYMRPDTVISERLRAILLAAGLSGWQTLPLPYCTETDGRVRLHYLVVTSRLPTLASQTELEREYNPVIRLTSLFQEGLLAYQRLDLGEAQDFNQTQEAFGPAAVSRHGLVISQRAWRVLLANQVEPFDVEPVVVVEAPA